MPEIRLEGVTKRYGKTEAVRNLSLDIHTGEYFTLLGAIGSGKTTTLMLLAGLIEPDAGEIYFDGKPMKGVPPEDRGIGFVFETFALFPNYNVWENITYGPRVKREDPTSTKKVADEMLEMVLLEDRPDALPDELSGGMKQRAALARALTSGAKILLFDEPLASLDAKIRVALANDLRRIVKGLGLTAIHVTNSVEEAMTISDRIAVMRNGSLEQVGTPRELYENPKTIFVMDFMGDINLFNGTVTRSGEGFTEVATQEGFLFRSSRATMEVGSKVHAVVRAEDIDITPRGSEEAPNKLHGIVKEKMFLLGFMKYLIELKTGQEVIVEVPFMKRERDLETGEAIAMEFALQSVYLFRRGESP
jgi:ABC-type Fe3+/spermidine/putrescine transport system ATPase subunit